MSQQQTDDSTSIDKEKTVTFVGYIDEDIMDVRRAVDDIFEADYYDTYMHESTTRKYIVDGEEKTCYDSSLFNALKEENLENIRCVEETKEEERYKTGVDYAVRELAEEHFENTVPEALPDEDLTIFGRRVRLNDDFSTILRVFSYFEGMRMLKHIDDAEEGDQFVDDDETEYPVLKAKMKIEAEDERTFERLDEKVVQPFYEFFWDCPLIERVRVRDCEIKTTEKGSCLNI